MTRACLFFLLFSVSCSRTTMVSGRVTNIRTGNPVAGMKVKLWVSDGHDPQDSVIPKRVDSDETVTGPNGEYTLECTAAGIDDAGLELNDKLLCLNYFETVWSGSVKVNAASEVNIQIDSVDGRLQLILQNQSGQSDKLYLKVDCDATGPKGVYCCNVHFENTIPAGQADTLIFPISADRYVPVYWGTDAFTGWNAPKVDSVYCPRYQTTPIVISF